MSRTRWIEIISAWLLLASSLGAQGLLVRGSGGADVTSDEGSGDVLGDSVGTNDGELGSASGADANDPNWVTEGLDFTAANSDRVRIPAFQDPETAWTLIFVAEWDTILTAANFTVFSQENGTGTGRSWMYVVGSDPDTLCSLIGGTGACSQTISTGYHTFTVSYSGSGTILSYLDGGSKASFSRTAEAASGQHKIGVSKTDTSPFGTILSWGRMYNRALSDAEVLAVHNYLKANIGRGISLP